MVNRRRRYPIEPRARIELRPPRLPANATWTSSRDDVRLEILEQRGEHLLVALDGPAGDVKIALLDADAQPRPRPVGSWKFKLVEQAEGMRDTR